MATRMELLYSRIMTLQASTPAPSDRPPSFDPKRTFLWLALFAETIQQLGDINLTIEDEIIESDKVFDMFIQWHADSTLSEPTMNEQAEFSGGRVKVALTMNASDTLSLSVCYWNLTQVKLSMSATSETNSLEHVDAILKCGIALIADKISPLGVNAGKVCEWIFLKNWLHDRTKNEAAFDGIIGKAKLIIPLRRVLVSLAQITKAYALFVGEKDALLGIQYQLIALTLLKMVIDPEFCKGTLDEIQQACDKTENINVSISQLYRLSIQNASLLKNHLLSIQLSLEYIGILKNRYRYTVTVEDVECLYEAQETMARSQYAIKQFTHSLASHQDSLATLQNTQLTINPLLSKAAYFQVANVLSTLKRYREALAYIRASTHCSSSEENKVEGETEDVHSLFLLGCLEYRCAMEIDSTSVPSQSAVLELLQASHTALQKAIKIAPIYLKETIAIQLSVLLVDLQRFDEAVACLKEHGISKQNLDACEKGRSGKGVIWSEPVWNTLMKLAVDDNDVLDRSLNV